MSEKFLYKFMVDKKVGTKTVVKKTGMTVPTLCPGCNRVFDEEKS